MGKVEIKPISINPHSIGNGTQKLYKFDNGYGASVVRFDGSYTSNDQEWELAVIKWKDEDNFSLEYGTPITADVLGHLLDSDVQKVLEKIKALKKAVNQ